jgi:16S rRNA (cytosine967-C5)-methyltransferase
VDRSVRRLQAFQQEAERLGYQRAVQTRAGLAQTVLPQLGQSFDRIVLDAPCSGLGVLRRRADARWRKRPDDLPRLAETQRELLAAAARVLAPDGVLVYSTCSVEPEETDAVIRFALDHLGLALERPTPYLPHADLAAYVVDDTVKLLPGDLGMDGFFIARLRPARADDRKVGRP